MTTTVIDLPMPPSLNSIWRYGKGRAFKSARYVAWLRAADAEFLLHRKEWAPVKGHFRVYIVLNEKKRRGNADCDNRGKALLDFCQRVGLIENDALCDRVVLEWGYAPSGCRILITSASIPVSAPGRPEAPQRPDGTYPAEVTA
jgi:Holliday junction resolvase RusA-like endonuclease